MNLAPEPAENRTLIDELLEEQRRLTAVEQFSQRHEFHKIPLQEKYYRELIPLTTPRPGEQFAFEVNLDSCSGCKACVTACHSLNGLDANETWRSVGVLLGQNTAQPLQRTVTTACHHCVEPGCLNGCPADAYEKDFSTGIVRHLDDQCIGCQYCTLTCPYDVPQYSAKRGIVRKCDMCHGRLAAGEAPACVQACPNGAITIRIVKKNEMVEVAKQNHFLPDAPNPTLTVPTTRYVSAKPLPDNTKAGDHNDLRTQHAHFPLVIMLVLTQISAGIFSLDFLTRLFAPELMLGKLQEMNLLWALTFGGLGLFASIFHLGRPSQAWRGVLGWRHSWLSREIICFGIFATLAALYAATFYFENPGNNLLSKNILSSAVCGTGLVGVFFSAMVYHATQREFWRLRFSVGKFFGTTLLLSLAALWLTGAFQASPAAEVFAQLLIPISIIKMLFELSIFRNLESEEETSLKRSARLMHGKLRWVTGLRLICGISGGVFLPLAFFANETNPAIPLSALLICCVGELAERTLFFTAVAPPKMPGGI